MNNNNRCCVKNLLQLGICLLAAVTTSAIHVNHTSQRHMRRNDGENNYFKEQRSPQAPERVYQPIFKSYPPVDNSNNVDYTYDGDYGPQFDMIVNRTESRMKQLKILKMQQEEEENPPLFPVPDPPRGGAKMKDRSVDDDFKPEILPEIELPDDSLADADLKDHNLIDSVTYLYGFTANNAMRTEWILLVYVSRALACILVIGTAVWVLWSESAKDFRTNSELYPVNVNLLCCLGVCNLIYMEAILGVSSDNRCEMVALLLHYAHLVCAVWLLALCWSVTDYCVRGTVPPLKYNYLFAYGVPAVMVMFNYALSMEQYETKHYCWMSLEKGMLFGFMLPGTVLIVVTTALVLLALRSVNRKQSEILANKIQELIEHQMTIAGDKNESSETLERVYCATESRKNTDSSDTLDNYNMDEDCSYNMGSPTEHRSEHRPSNEMNDDFLKMQSIKFGLMNMSIDNLSWKSASYTEINELKGYLNFCLVIQPFYAVVWVMGVVALENSSHWLTPSIFLILCTSMYIYLAVQMCTNLPRLQTGSDEPASCCEELISEPTLPRTRTTDSIPLLDSVSCPQQNASAAAPGDTISTISI